MIGQVVIRRVDIQYIIIYCVSVNQVYTNVKKIAPTCPNYLLWYVDTFEHRVQYQYYLWG